MLHVPVTAGANGILADWVRKVAGAVNQLIGKFNTGNLDSLGLLDLAGNDGKAIVVNAAEDGFELVAGAAGGTTSELLTFNSGGAGAASGATFDGSAPTAISYNSIGAQAAGSYLTGNQTITLSGDATGSGATSITVTLANDAVTYAKFQSASAGNVVLTRANAAAGDYGETALAASQLLGRGSSGNVGAIGLGYGLGMSGTTLSVGGLTPPVLADFPTSLSIGAESFTADTSEGMAFSVGTGGAGTVVRCLLKTLPSEPYTITFKMDVYGEGTTADGVGLILRDSASGRLIKFGLNLNATAAQVIVERWTNNTTFSAASKTVTNSGTHNPWLRVRNDATNLIYELALTKDGPWMPFFGEGKTAWLAAADQVGFGIEDQGLTTYMMLVRHYQQT